MKTALITGAARGIGLATARRFLDDGWNVALLDRDSEELVRVATGMANACAVHADVSHPDQVGRAIEETLSRFGRLDALVNNAGVADFGPIWHAPIGWSSLIVSAS